MIHRNIRIQKKIYSVRPADTDLLKVERTKEILGRMCGREGQSVGREWLQRCSEKKVIVT